MKIVYFLFLALFLTACGDSEGDAADNARDQATLASQEAAFQSMMDGHDRVMPLMNQITQKQRTITEALTTGGHGEDYRELLIAANEQLEDANDAMMDWMNQHQRPLDELRETMKEDEVMGFLREGSTSIAAVEADMKTSLANADQILNNTDHGAGGDHDH